MIYYKTPIEGTSTVRPPSEGSGPNWNAAAILVLFNVVSVLSIIPSATPRNRRHAIMFVKLMYIVMREYRAARGAGETINAKFVKENNIEALRHQANIR